MSTTLSVIMLKQTRIVSSTVFFTSSAYSVWYKSKELNFQKELPLFFDPRLKDGVIAESSVW